MVYMAHNGDHRRTVKQLIGRIHFRFYDGFFFKGCFFQLKSEFRCDQAGGVIINGLIDRDHHAHAHQFGNQFVGFYAHPFAEVCQNNCIINFKTALNSLGDGNLCFLTAASRSGFESFSTLSGPAGALVVKCGAFDHGFSP